MGQIPLEVISKNTKGKKIARKKQDGFAQSKFCLASLSVLFGERTGSVHKGRAVDDLYLDYSNTFHTVSHNIHTGKLVRYGQRKSGLYSGLPDSRVIISGINHAGYLQWSKYYLMYLLTIWMKG